MFGKDGGDQFHFSGKEPFKKKTANAIIDFDTGEGDQIIIADQVFFHPIITNSVLEDLRKRP